MAFDAARGDVVLFGGGGLADTWTWDGKAWKQQHPTTVPPGRSGAGMTYNPTSRYVLMWGGYEGNAQAADFWAWDGSNWAQIQSPGSPPPEDNQGWAFPAPVLTYDSFRHLVILIRNNGHHPTVPLQPDVWTWDGTAWSHPTIESPPTIWGTATYDAALGAVMFFGVDSTMSPQTWTLGAARWMRLQSVVAPTFPLDDPPPIVNYDVANTVALVDASGGVWVWSGTDWTMQSGSTTLQSARGDYSVVFDAARGVLLRFGGADAAGRLTWVWNGHTWTQAE